MIFPHGGSSHSSVASHESRDYVMVSDEFSSDDYVNYKLLLLFSIKLCRNIISCDGCMKVNF